MQGKLSKNNFANFVCEKCKQKEKSSHTGKIRKQKTWLESCDPTGHKALRPRPNFPYFKYLFNVKRTIPFKIHAIVKNIKIYRSEKVIMR